MNLSVGIVDNIARIGKAVCMCHRHSDLPANPICRHPCVGFISTPSAVNNKALHPVQSRIAIGRNHMITFFRTNSVKY